MMENCNFYTLKIPCLSPVAGIPASQVRHLPIMHYFPHKANLILYLPLGYFRPHFRPHCYAFMFMPVCVCVCVCAR